MAALQFTNILFSVPQISVRLNEIPKDHYKMIAFYTDYWIKNKHIFLDGKFTAYKPLANYPYLSAYDEHKKITGVYEDVVVPVDDKFTELEFINAKLSRYIVLKFSHDQIHMSYTTFDCRGNTSNSGIINALDEFVSLAVPANGLIQIILKR